MVKRVVWRQNARKVSLKGPPGTDIGENVGLKRKWAAVPNPRKGRFKRLLEPKMAVRCRLKGHLEPKCS